MQIRTFRQKFLSSAAFRRFAASTFGACFLWDTIQLLPPVPVPSSENQVSQQTPPHYITSLFNIQPTILPEYVLFFIVFSQNTCFFPLLLCALTKAPTENGSQKRFTIFLQMLCCSKMTQKTRVQTERICIMLTGKTIILGVTGGIAAYKAANLASL